MFLFTSLVAAERPDFAFSFTGHNRPSLLKALPAVMTQLGLARRDVEGAQSSLFDMMSADELKTLLEDWYKFVKLPDDWEAPDFKECKKHRCIHCWKNHVPSPFKDIWETLTQREKIIIAFEAEVGSENEE